MPHPMLPGVVTMLHATWAGAPPIRRIPVQPINEPEQTFVIELESLNQELDIYVCLTCLILEVQFMMEANIEIREEMRKLRS